MVAELERMYQFGGTQIYTAFWVEKSLIFAQSPPYRHLCAVLFHCAGAKFGQQWYCVCLTDVDTHGFLV